jgi:hypothetical protein
VPTISTFYGIVIRMYYDDHNPPHFHAVYNEYEASVSIADFTVLMGDLPPKAMGLVMEWARVHQRDLEQEWQLAKDMKRLFPIEPLN